MTEAAVPPLTILVCEDEAIIALGLEQALDAMGHRVCAVVGTADDAVAGAIRHRPHVVMMDVMLRGSRDGIDAAGEILERTGIRSLFMTAVDAPAVRRRAAEVQALGLLLKPYRAEELCRVLRSLSPPADEKVLPARREEPPLRHLSAGLAWRAAL